MTPAKIERFTIRDYEFQSTMPDIGLWKKRLKFHRKNPRMDAAMITTKSALTGGQVPLTRAEAVQIDAMATLSVYVEPVNDKGEPTNENSWIEDLFDQEILFDIYNKWSEYQTSFYPKQEVPTETAPPVQG